MSERKGKTASKAELRREIAGLRMVGGLMANLCFNIGQHYNPMLHIGSRYEITNADLETMQDLRKQWDAIDREEIANA